MAILLIFDHDNTHLDPEKDQAGCYKMGDIVNVHDDSKHDGDLEKNPIAAPWYMIKIPDVSVEQIQHICQPEINNDKHIRRREFNFEFNQLPENIKQILQEKRYIELSLHQIRTFIRNKNTRKMM